MTRQQSKTYDSLPGNADSFAADLEKHSNNIPYTRIVDATNANAFVYSDHVHMLETWNQVMDANITINANNIWGTCDWT